MNIFRVEEACNLLSNKKILKFKNSLAIGASIGTKVFGLCSCLWQKTQRTEPVDETEDFAPPDDEQIQALLEASEADFGMGDSRLVDELDWDNDGDSDADENVICLGDRRVPVSIQRADGQLSKEILESQEDYGASIIALHLKRSVINADLAGVEEAVFEMAGSYGCNRLAVKLLSDACRARGASKQLALRSDDALVLYDEKSVSALVIDPRGLTTIRPLRRLAGGEVAVENAEVLNADPEKFLEEFASTLVREVLSNSKDCNFVSPDRGIVQLRG